MYSGRVTRVLADGSTQIGETHTLRISGVHDGSTGGLKVKISGPALDGTNFEQSFTLSNFTDCKFDIQVPGVPKGDFLVTVSPENPTRVVSSSQFVSVR